MKHTEDSAGRQSGADDPRVRNTWIIRLKRRRDGRKYYYRHDCCTTARKESSMRLDEKTAKQLALAISSQHPDFYAWAVPYSAGHASRRAEAAAASRRAEEMLMDDDAVDYSLVEHRADKEQDNKPGA